MLVLGLLLGGAGLARAQERVHGRVTSGSDGTPLIGATVHVPGTSAGTLTNSAGEYNLTLPRGAQTLEFSYIGYATLDVPINGRTQIDAALETRAVSLNALVVVGYTTQTKRTVSDATAGVTAAQLSDVKVATVEEALQGKVAGVQIAASGEPGRPAQVIVRGQNFLGDPTPLYVVDGMYMREDPNLNPDDIESVEVLKDASAAAQYGSQSANGVVVIRTKRGRPGTDNKVEIHSFYGFQGIPKRIDMMSAQQWASIEQQAYTNAGKPVPAGITAALSGSGLSTDWQNAVFRNGAIQDHNLTLSGGSSFATYLVSGGFLDQQGAMITTNFRRYSLRVNSDLMRGHLRLGENVALSRSLQHGITGGAGYPLIDVVRMLPTIPVRDSANASGYGYGDGGSPTFGTNPVGMLETRPRSNTSNQVIGSAFGEWQLFPSLHYRLNLGANYENFARSEFNSIGEIRMATQPEFADLTEFRNNFTSLLVENLLTYNGTFGEGAHRLNAVGGYTQQTLDGDYLQGYRRNFSDEALRTLAAGGESNQTAFGTTDRAVKKGWLARANYTLLNRYLLTGSVRRDGSSRFAPTHRWGTFGAASAGWILSDEPFFKTLPLVRDASLLKLRGSYGVLGNDDIGNYRFQAPISQNRLGYSFGGQILPGATQLQLVDANYHWQSNKVANAGVDLGLFADRLLVTADYYRSTADGLLVTAPLPPSAGTGGDVSRSPTVNAGSMRNSGFELSLSHKYGPAAAGAFHLNTTATLTTTRNKVLSLGNGGQPLFDNIGVARTTVGSPVGTFYLVHMLGIFQSAADVQNYKNSAGKIIQPNAQPGDVKYQDTNGDGVINDDDRIEVGNGTPKVSGGLFFDGGLGRIDFGVNLRGAGGFKIFNTVKYWTDRMDDPSNFRAGFSPWTPDNHSNTTPRPLAVGSDNTRFNSDRWIEKGDYLRIQNIVLGYRLPGSLTQRVGLSSATEARIYVNAQNLYTFTGYSNWDPETLGYGNPLGRGIDDGFIYPNVRTISVGVDVRL